jgi:hypothetical protein
MTISLKRFYVPVGILVIGLLGLGFFVLFGQSKFRGLEAFPAATYLESPVNLHGNRYLLDAWIDGQLVWREGVGRILEVRPASGQGKLAIYVPENLKQNLYVGQRYRMDVTVKQGGLIHVQDLEKY